MSTAYNLVKQPEFEAVDLSLVERFSAGPPAVSSKKASLLICSGNEQNATEIAAQLANNTQCEDSRIFWLAPPSDSSSVQKAKEYIRKTQSWKRTPTANSELVNKRCFADITDKGGYELYSKIERHPQIPVTPHLLDFQSSKDLKISIGSIYNVVELKDGHKYAAPLVYSDLATSFNWGGLVRDCVLFSEISLENGDSDKSAGNKRQALSTINAPDSHKVTKVLVRRQSARQAASKV